MLYVLLVLGVILTVVFLPETFRQKQRDPEKGHYRVGDRVEARDLEPVLAKIQELQHQVELLHEGFLEMKSKNSFPGERAVASAFGQVLEEKKLPPAENDFKQAVISSFEQGRTVTEIAREFDKGKGEIELILNLRR
ncbi:MAG TPA: hypothetical protein GX711_09095 [Clostridia bacterium]|nr:hypothetical protein [Clostridia bacterium]